MQKLFVFFDTLEDKVRFWLSRRPVLYALIGGVGIVLFWRGVWHGMDFIMNALSVPVVSKTISLDNGSLWWDAPFSLFVGSILLLVTGVFVSNFIGNEIIISGLKGEKKMIEKTEEEIQEEEWELQEVRHGLQKIFSRLDRIEKAMTKLEKNFRSKM
ncbi:MAG TPA: hypothetical protein VJB99_04340 [Patescibacteria group bacterium]|nr:hypothetical protein [Patescibacteria group bacterium]